MAHSDNGCVTPLATLSPFKCLCIDWLPLCAVYFGFYICSYAHPFSTPQEQLESISPGLAELCPVVLYCTHLGCRTSSSHSTPRAVDCGCTRLLCIWFASLRVSHYFFVSSSSFNVYIKLFHLSILYICMYMYWQGNPLSEYLWFVCLLFWLLSFTKWKKWCITPVHDVECLAQS